MAAQKGESAEPEVEDTKELKHQSIAQVIYAQNRVSNSSSLERIVINLCSGALQKTAQDGHDSLTKLGYQPDIPCVLVSEREIIDLHTRDIDNKLFFFSTAFVSSTI